MNIPHFRDAQRMWDPVTLSDAEIRKVLKFPKVGVFAQFQAKCSAEALETERRDTRKEEIKRLIAGYEKDRAQLDHVIATLREEHALLEFAR